MSNFSFSPLVFKRLVLQTCKNKGLIGKPTMLIFTKPKRLNCCTKYRAGVEMYLNLEYNIKIMKNIVKVTISYFVDSPTICCEQKCFENNLTVSYPFNP